MTTLTDTLHIPAQQSAAAKAALELAHELEQLGVRGVKDSEVVQTIADNLLDVITRPDRDVGH